MSRFAAYGWLANQLGLTREECHIGNFDVITCERVVEVCAQWQKDRAWKPAAPKKAKKPPQAATTADGLMSYTVGDTLIVGEKGTIPAHLPPTGDPIDESDQPKSPW